MFSHGLLDAALKKTYGGVELLWPFSARHYKLAILDYFAFYPDSKLDPMWILILRALQISFYELVIFGSVFLLVGLVRREICALVVVVADLLGEKKELAANRAALDAVEALLETIDARVRKAERRKRRA